MMYIHEMNYARIIDFMCQTIASSRLLYLTVRVLFVIYLLI